MRDAGKALGMLCAWIIAWADGARDFFVSLVSSMDPGTGSLYQYWLR